MQGPGGGALLGNGNDQNGGNELINSSSKSSKRYQMIEDAYFKLLANLRRKKPQHHRLSLLAAVLDFIQLIPFVCLPLVAWPAGTESVFVNVISRFRIAGLVIPSGFDAFRILYWVNFSLVLLAFLTCCVSLWSAVRGTTQSTWFVRFVRRNLLFLPQALFLSSLEILWIPWRCNYQSGGSSQNLVDFPTVACWGGANAPMAVVGVIGGILLIGMSVSATFFQFDLNVQSRQPQAIASAEIPVTAVFLRAMMVIVVVAMFPIPFWQAAVVAAIFTYWFLQHLQEESYFSHTNNAIRGGALGALAFASAWQLATAFFNQPTVTVMGTIFPILAAVGAVVGYWFSSSYLSSLDCTSPNVTRLNPETNDFVAVLRFEDTMQPEMCCRVLREIGVSQAGVDRASAVWNAAIAQYGERPDVLISHSRFLTTYALDPSKANHALQKVRRLKTTFQQRYSLFLFEQEGQRLRTRTAAGDSTMDLTTYVAFQAQMKVVQRAHRRVLFEVRKFWRQVHAEDSLSADGQLTMAGLPPTIPPSAAVTAAAAAAAASVPPPPQLLPPAVNPLALPGTPGVGAATLSAGGPLSASSSFPAGPGGAALATPGPAAGRRGSILGATNATGGALTPNPMASAVSPRGPPPAGTPAATSGSSESARRPPPIIAVASMSERHIGLNSADSSGTLLQGLTSAHSVRGGGGGGGVSAYNNNGANNSAASIGNSAASSKRRQSRFGNSSGNIQRTDSNRSEGGGSAGSGINRSSSSGRIVTREEAAKRKIISAYRRSLVRFGYPKWFSERAASYLPTAVISWLISGSLSTTPAQQIGLRFSAVTRLAKLCARIDKLAEEAARTYAQTLERYPKSSKLMRSYARFELELNQNQRLASRLTAAADKLDEAAGGNDGGDGGDKTFDGGFKASSLVDDNVDGLIVIDTRGLILSANRVCSKLL